MRNLEMQLTWMISTLVMLSRTCYLVSIHGHSQHQLRSKAGFSCSQKVAAGGNQSRMLPCLCLAIEYKGTSPFSCLLPFKMTRPPQLSCSHPWANNNLQGNACTDCLSNQHMALELGDGVSFFWKIRLERESGQTNKIWFSFPVLKKEAGWVRRENG